MKTIGFIDYFLSEWHANNYPQWIKDICEESGEDFCVKYAWAELETSPYDGVTTDEWCEKFGVEKCNTIEELCEKADYILVLSPDNPERHLDYAKTVFKYKKNTYVDKTFAPSYEVAKQIFDIGAEYGTKFFSTSALRYATELDEIIDPSTVIIQGGGPSIDIYAIHMVEMGVKLLAAEPTRVKVEQLSNKQCICMVEFEGNKKASIVYGEGYPFSICSVDSKGQSTYKAVKSETFKRLLKDILRFYKTGEYSFDTNQTLCAMKLCEGIQQGKTKPGEWINL